MGARGRSRLREMKGSSALATQSEEAMEQSGKVSGGIGRRDPELLRALWAGDTDGAAMRARGCGCGCTCGHGECAR